MAESAALLVDEVFPEQPMRQQWYKDVPSTDRRMEWMLSFPYPLRFLFTSQPAIMGQVLGIVYRFIATHLIKKAGFSCQTAHTGAVTLIQRFGSALNLNIHLMCMDARMPRVHGCAGASHMLFLDGVYVERSDGWVRFRWVKVLTSNEITQLADRIARRVGRLDAHHPWHVPCGRTSYVQIRSRRICLERHGLLERAAQNSYLAGETVEADPMDQRLGHSITYRIAVG